MKKIGKIINDNYMEPPYLYTQSNNFVFPDELEDISQTSPIQPIETDEGCKIIFTRDSELNPAILFEKHLLTNFPEVLDKISPHLKRKSRIDEKMALITNYLVHPDFTVVPNSAKLEAEDTLTFKATHDMHSYKVTLIKNQRVEYKLISSK